jgi:hypothetical protein
MFLTRDSDIYISCYVCYKHLFQMWGYFILFLRLFWEELNMNFNVVNSIKLSI